MLNKCSKLILYINFNIAFWRAIGTIQVKINGSQHSVQFSSVA